MNKKTTIDLIEVSKFAQLATEWWNPDGPLKTLHDINPIRIDFITKFVQLSDRTVLDVGCGGGILSEKMASLGSNVTGLDVEKDAVAAAEAHANKNQISIVYICQPIEEYPQKEFDIVTCMEMLEHVSDPLLVIEQCARLLKPGGHLFLSTINRTIAAYLAVILAAEYILELLPRQTHDYEKFIKPSELATMVRAAGLETIGMAGIAYNPFKRTASLQDSVAVNYLLACRKL